MEGLLNKLQSAINQQPLNLDYLEFLTRHQLILFGSFSEQIGGMTEIADALENVHHAVQREINFSCIPIVVHEVEIGPDPGRPKIVIEVEKLKSQRDTHLPLSCIAKCLVVSRRTLNKRMQELGLSIRGSYSTVTDGYRMVQGHLISNGSDSVAENDGLYASC